MFHANAWGLPYAAVFAGASMVMPGPNMVPTAIAGMLRDHDVTFTGGVPTIWMGVLPELSGPEDVRACDCAVRRLRGAESLWRRPKKIGLPITQAWGMTETSPIATTGMLRSIHDGVSKDELADIRATRDQPGAAGGPAARRPRRRRDPAVGRRTSGELQALGAWIADSYLLNEDGGKQFTADGWLRTGDVAVIDPNGCVNWSTARRTS